MNSLPLGLSRGVGRIVCAAFVGLFLSSVAEGAWVKADRWTILLKGPPAPAARQTLQGGGYVIEDLLRGFVLVPSPSPRPPTSDPPPSSDRPRQDRPPQDTTRPPQCQAGPNPRTRPPQILLSRVARGRRWGDTLTIGVPLTTLMDLTFSEPMLLQSLRTATTVLALVNQRGETIRTTLPVDLRPDPCGVSLTLHPPNGRWPANHTLQLTIAKTATAPDGTPLTTSFTHTLTTVLDPREDNVAVASDGQTRLWLPAGALTTEAYVIISLDPASTPERINPGTLAQASSHLQQTLGPLARPLLIRELRAYNTEGAVLPEALGQLGTLTVPYPDADGDGLVDGMTPLVRVHSLTLWALDESQGRWTRLARNSLNPSTRMISASIPRWGTYALIAGPADSLADAFAFPVPWRPHVGNPLAGSVAEGITFTNLMSDCTILIYTITGELVSELKHQSGLPSLRWDVTTAAGEPVASGVYLYHIRSVQDEKIGKLMVIR